MFGSKLPRLATRLADGVDPGARRKTDDQGERVAHLHTVEATTRAWFDKYRLTWTESHLTRTHSRFEKHVFPWIGRHPIRDVKQTGRCDPPRTATAQLRRYLSDILQNEALVLRAMTMFRGFFLVLVCLWLSSQFPSLEG